jgi:hypothetical protein
VNLANYCHLEPEISWTTDASAAPFFSSISWGRCSWEEAPTFHCSLAVYSCASLPPWVLSERQILLEYSGRTGIDIPRPPHAPKSVFRLTSEWDYLFEWALSLNTLNFLLLLKPKSESLGFEEIYVGADPVVEYESTISDMCCTADAYVYVTA